MAYSALEKSSTQQIHGSKLIPSICKPSGFQHVSSRGMCCRDPLSMVSHQVTFGRFVMRTLEFEILVKRHRSNIGLTTRTWWSWCTWQDGEKKVGFLKWWPQVIILLIRSFISEKQWKSNDDNFSPWHRPWPPAAPKVSRACAARCTLHCGTAGTRTAAWARRSGRPQPLELAATRSTRCCPVVCQLEYN